MTWFQRDPSQLVMSVLYLLGIALMLPVLLVYYLGCSVWCLVTVIARKFFSDPPYSDVELS